MWYVFYEGSEMTSSRTGSLMASTMRNVRVSTSSASTPWTTGTIRPVPTTRSGATCVNWILALEWVIKHQTLKFSYDTSNKCDNRTKRKSCRFPLNQNRFCQHCHCIYCQLCRGGNENGKEKHSNLVWYPCIYVSVVFKDNISRINWWSNGTTLKGPASEVGLFVCNNTEQINTVFVCDGLADCSDASDEDNCSKCHPRL